MVPFFLCPGLGVSQVGGAQDSLGESNGFIPL